ncbi:zf-HC2 domain-containing protein [Corynebacterium freneyi]|uniref:zf-HC2 domain-containing protein n=1 Tax=Corynebacterium freneyi TaxID=134034 RepID=UPI0005518B68|nr:zf-HC2 domain-containing protein [Corynebacterium freneyi]
MAAPHQEFASTDHLGTEAVAAFVDGELGVVAHRRAQAHLLACAECRREVARQRQAARRLRNSGEVRIPAELRERLASLSREQMPENAPGARHLSHRRPDSLAAFFESTWRTLRGPRYGQ